MSLRLLMVSIVAALAVVPSAQALTPSPAWMTGEAVSSQGVLPQDLEVAQLPDGRRAIAWSEDAAYSSSRVFVRVERPGGGFGPEQAFLAHALDVRLIAGAHGTLALVWSTSFGGAPQIHVALRAPEGGPFSEVTPLTVTGGPDYFRNLDAAFLDDGAGHDIPYVGFIAFTSVVNTAWVARVAPGDTGLIVVPGITGGGLESVAHPGGASVNAYLGLLRVATAADGVLVTYTRQVSGGSQPSSTRVTAVHSTTAAGTAFGAPAAVDTRTNPVGVPLPLAYVAAAGGPLGTQLAWSYYKEPDLWLRRQGRTVRLQTSPSINDDLRLAVDAGGTSTLAWNTYASDHYGVSAARVPAGGDPAPTQALTAPGLSHDLRGFALGADGTALVVVGDDDDNDNDEPLEAYLAPPGGAFGPSEALPGEHASIYSATVDQEVAALVTPDGHPFVLWVAAGADDPAGQRVRVAERDVTPPVIAQADGPATATVGARVTFAGSAADELTGVALRWDFGDGSFADGGTATHAFATPGAKTVTLTATDGAGHAVSRALTVSVAPRPPEAGGPGTPPGTVQGDRTAPVLKGLSLSRATFRAGSGATAIAAKANKKTKATPAGTTIRITSLSERATLVITFTRKVDGRTRTEGTLVRAARGPGAVSLPFSGRIGKAALAAGNYTMSVVAVDAAGNRANQAATATLKVAAR